jgi:hypothetical protein
MPHSLLSGPSLPRSGQVLYLQVPGMGSSKVRPCVVLFQRHSDLWLVPLSSDTWLPSKNPVVHFKDGMSFAVLDRAFALPARSRSYFRSFGQISMRAVDCCIRSLRKAMDSGSIVVPDLQFLKGRTVLVPSLIY